MFHSVKKLLKKPERLFLDGKHKLDGKYREFKLRFHLRAGEKLGLKELIAIGVGGMIGGGIFSVLGLAVKLAGSAAPISFVIDLLIALTAGYHYVRLALTFRDDGASYTYLRRAFPSHPWISAMEGWTVIVGYIGTLSLYAFTFGAYAADMVGLANNNIARMVFSIGILLLFFWINAKGVKSSGETEDIVVYSKLLILFSFATLGLFNAKPERFKNVLGHGIPDIFLGAAIIFVAYEGFQLITNAVNETDNPDKNIPRGIYGSILVTGTVYFLLSVVAVGTLSYSQIVKAKEYALAAVAQPILGNWGVALIGIAALMATSSAINSTMFGACRMMAEMAEKDIMPSKLSIRNNRNVPIISLMILTFFSSVLTLLGSLNIIAEFSSMTFLIVSIGVSIANIKLKSLTHPNIPLAISGLILMLITTSIIIAYVLRTNIVEALSIGLIYLLTGIISILYVKLHPQTKENS